MNDERNHVDANLAAWFLQQQDVVRHEAFFYPDEAREIPVGQRLKITVEFEEDKRDDYPWSVAK